MGPRKCANPALDVRSHGAVVVLTGVLGEGADPHLEDAARIRRGVGETFAIRRELRIEALGVAKEQLDWNQGAGLGGGGSLDPGFGLGSGNHASWPPWRRG